MHCGIEPVRPEQALHLEAGEQKYTVVSNGLDTNLQWDWVMCIL